MIKKPLNQNAKYAQEIIDEVEPYFIYSKKRKIANILFFIFIISSLFYNTLITL